MNHAQVLHGIAEFVDYDECVVIKQSDWDVLKDWINSLPTELLESRPNFDLLPVVFSKDDENNS